MSDVYILKNQHHALLDKSGNWLTSGDRKQLFRTPNKDEAVNQRVEIAVKHPDLRIELQCVALDSKGLPEVNLPRPVKTEQQSETMFNDDSDTASARPNAEFLEPLNTENNTSDV